MTRGQAVYRGMCLALGLEPDVRGTQSAVSRLTGIPLPNLQAWRTGQRDLTRADEDRLRQLYRLVLYAGPDGGWSVEVLDKSGEPI